MIGEEEKILERWTEYFTEMLNEEEEDKEDKEDYKRNLTGMIDHAPEQLQETCKEPTRQEIGKCPTKNENKRAPGEDTIVAELIKYGGERVMDAVHELINMNNRKYAPRMEYRNNMPDIQERRQTRM